jgi:glyoxylase-like metal-dependent hydrolase (beta-lactamase superfamily II)
MTNPDVKAFFDEATYAYSYVVHDPRTRKAAIVDSVLGFDPASGRTDTTSADALIDSVRAGGLEVEWILDTHVHADHLSAAAYLKSRLGGRTAIGAGVRDVQETFGRLFNEGADFRRDGSQFDHLFEDGETYRVGGVEAVALHTPGHTPACMTHVIGDAAFVGDTLFMPDYGTARCDFPGGDARRLYRSVQRLFGLPDATRVFLCHDYKAPGRDEYACQTTIGAERRANVHVHEGVDEDEFVRLRTSRDATLAMPRLLLPSVQVNMRAGAFPPPEANGLSYLKLPVDAL